MSRYGRSLIDLKKETLKKLWTPLRFVIGIGLIAVLLWRFNVTTILTHIRQLMFLYVCYACSAYLLFVVFSAWRWQVLLDHKRFKIPLIRTIAIYFIALFFNNLLPTTVGGDIMRVVYVMEKRRADALATVIVDRILGFVGLFLFALGAVVFMIIDKRQTEFLPFMLAGFIAVVLITYVFFSERAYGILSPVIGKIKVLRLGDRLNHLHGAATDFGGAWSVIILCVVLSVIIQALLAIAPFFVIRGMGNMDISIVPFFIYVPIINVISMVPVSLNALGVREYSYVLLFERAGLQGETAIAVSLVSFFLIFALSLLGGVAFLFVRKTSNTVSADHNKEVG